MGLFTRRQREGPVVTSNTAATGGAKQGWFGGRNHGTTKKTTKQRRQPLILPMDRRPTFGQWLKATWLDILTMAIMGIIGLGVC
jgi:diacylglycerol diphosphate phosphatase/phosphatidate phosphatase